MIVPLLAPLVATSPFETIPKLLSAISLYPFSARLSVWFMPAVASAVVCLPHPPSARRASRTRPPEPPTGRMSCSMSQLIPSSASYTSLLPRMSARGIVFESIQSMRYGSSTTRSSCAAPSSVVRKNERSTGSPDGCPPAVHQDRRRRLRSRRRGSHCAWLLIIHQR